MPHYISIIIPTKNAGDRFDSVLKAIFKSKINFGFEVIVIDSGSKDTSKEIILKYPARLIEIPPISFGHGKTRNLGAKNAKGDILVFITQDATPKDENWLSNLVKHLEDKNIAGVYGRQIPYENSSPLEKFFLMHLYPEMVIVKTSVNPNDCLLKDIFFSNVNSAIRKSEWENHSFDENLIMSEDQEWAKYMLMRGKKIIYEPEAAVYHSHNYSILEIIHRNFDSGMSLKDLVNASLKKSVLYEMEYLKDGFLFFLNNRLYLYLLIFPLYESVRMLGFFLGFHSRFLPICTKKVLSQNKIYWQARDTYRYGNN